VARKPRDGALQERADGVSAFVVERFGVGQPGAVVNTDVHELPARSARLAAALAPIAGDPMPDTGHAPELLDVDVHELARPGALVAMLGPIGVRARQPATAVAVEHRRDGRVRDPQRLGDLGRSEAQLTQRKDRLHARWRRPMRHTPRCRGAIRQALLALLAIALDPLARRSLTDARRLGRVSDQPTGQDTIHQQFPAVGARPGVAMQCHSSGPSWDCGD
jgi:hypothetical protein